MSEADVGKADSIAEGLGNRGTTGGVDWDWEVDMRTGNWELGLGTGNWESDM